MMDEVQRTTDPGRRGRRIGIVSLLVVLAGVAVVGCRPATEEQQASERASESGFRGVTLPDPIEKTDFTLTDTDGEPFAFREETDGYVTLLFFGYTHCPDVCPVHMANLAAVLENFSWEVRDRIKVVFVTTDPERDTRERIREWLDTFDPSFIGLRGSRDEVNGIQAQFNLPPAVTQRISDDDDYQVGHASQVIAFSVDGRAKVIYPFGTRQRDWAHDLPQLVEAAEAQTTEATGEAN